jgi:hypothetical protein
MGMQSVLGNAPSTIEAVVERIEALSPETSAG